MDQGDAGTELWCADLGTRLMKPHRYPVDAAGLYCLATEDGTPLALDLDNYQRAQGRDAAKAREYDSTFLYHHPTLT